MRRIQRYLLFLLLAVLASPLFLPRVGIAAPPSAGPDAVVKWNDIAQRIVYSAAQGNAEAVIAMSLTQAAVYDALVAIQGKYPPYKLNLKPRPNASVDAAVAAAAHDILVHYFPRQRGAIEFVYESELAEIPDDTSKQEGLALGQEAAAGIIAERHGDAIGADIGFKMPPPAPGVWQLPAGARPLDPWLANYRPFMLSSPQQLRPGPPLALSSSQWADEFNQVKRVGGCASADRTPEQTEIAEYWGPISLRQFYAVFKGLVKTRQLDAVEAARLYGMGSLVGADALIACWDAKYHYLFWRPEFAVPLANTSQNPDTVGDPNWASYFPTPPHPEYPSAHGCFVGAEAQALALYLGTEAINIDLTSPSPNLAAPTRHFATVNDLVAEAANARIWGGLHYRSSTLAGQQLGSNVAKWTLARNFLPVSSTWIVTAMVSEMLSGYGLWLGSSLVVVLFIGILLLARMRKK